MTQRALAAEAIGTFTLVFGGCGTAMFAGPTAGLVAVAFAFGLTVLTMAYSVGHISGGHFNPAVTLGLVASGRFPAANALSYIIAQVVGAILAAAVLWAIASGVPMGGNPKKFQDLAAVSNFFGAGGAAIGQAFLVEFVMTALFLFVIISSTSRRAPAGFAPIAIGLALTLFHLLSIPLTNTSLNPARALAPALFAGGKPMADVWLFLIAPTLGGVAGGIVSRWLQSE